MDLNELITWVAGSSVFSSVSTLLISKSLGKKKEDIEVALRYQEFYQKHINDLRKEIEQLTEKVNTLIEQDKEKESTIEQQRLNLLRWEDNCNRLEGVIKQKDKQIAKLFKEIQEHEKNG